FGLEAENKSIRAVVKYIFLGGFCRGSDWYVVGALRDVPICVTISGVNRNPRVNVPVTLDGVQIAPVVNRPERERIGHHRRQNSCAPGAYLRSQQRFA